MISQMNQVFGVATDHEEVYYQDWAKERFTCSAADRADTNPEHSSEVANPMLRRALWDKKLFLGGSETAARAAGYLEGRAWRPHDASTVGWRRSKTKEAARKCK